MLCDLPTAVYPDATEGVTLATTRTNEIVGYSFHKNGFVALEHLIDLCGAMPVHAVYGAKKDMMCAFLSIPMNGEVDEVVVDSLF